MTFWGGSGSADPCLLLMDPDPDPAIFVIDLQDACKKLIFLHNFFCLLLFEGIFTSFFKDKRSKKSQNSRNPGFSDYYCMMIEGSGSGSATLVRRLSDAVNILYVRIPSVCTGYSYRCRNQTSSWGAALAWNTCNIQILVVIVSFHWLSKQ